MAKSLFYLDVVNFSKHHMDPQVSGKFQEATYSTDFPQPQTEFALCDTPQHQTKPGVSCGIQAKATLREDSSSRLGWSSVWPWLHSVSYKQTCPEAILSGQ